MAYHCDAEALTGLQVGGISALALLNKGFEICIDQAARQLDRIAVSAGQRGVDLYLDVSDLVRVTGARWVDARPVGTGGEEASFPSPVTDRLLSKGKG
jgi:Cys-tRNA(Pro)/Cys-tRNA(Cys) deacylase